MTFDLKIGWEQIRWVQRYRAKRDGWERDTLNASIKAMFNGLEIASIEVDRINFHNPKPIKIQFANEHELTAARLLI